MGENNITLRDAVRFHGHLGPYLVLGLLAGKEALKRLGCKKYFGLNIKAYGANLKPKSCLIDGLQLSSGTTYGKGNIQKFNGKRIRIVFQDTLSRKTLKMSLKDDLIKALDCLKGHKDSEDFAKKIFNTEPSDLFKII